MESAGDDRFAHEVIQKCCLMPAGMYLNTAV